jgi:hypothetical protein
MFFGTFANIDLLLTELFFISYVFFLTEVKVNDYVDW